MTTRKLTDLEALHWLRERGTIETTIVALAAEWGGWDRMTATRRLRSWQADGLITQAPSADGKRTVITAMITPGPGVIKPEHGNDHDDQGDHDQAEQGMISGDHVLKKTEHDVIKPQNSADEQEVITLEQPARQSEQTRLSRAAMSTRDHPLLRSDQGRDRGGDHRDQGERPGDQAMLTRQSTGSNVVLFRSGNAIAQLLERREEEIAKALDEATRPEPEKPSEPVRAAVGVPATHRPADLLGRRLLSCLAAVAASSLGYHALTMNWLYGKSLDEAHHLAGLGLTLDALALIAPTIALLLVERRLKVIAWTAWSAAVVYAFIATIGFSALNISNRTADAEKQVDAYAGARESLRQDQEARRGIKEARSPETIERAIQAALANVKPAGAATSTKGCTDVTLAASAAACADVLKLREAQEAARQRDLLDQRIAQGKTDVEGRKAVAVADPAPAEVAALFNWGIGRLITITPNDVENMRLLLLALLPHIAGLLFEMAASLWRRRA